MRFFFISTAPFFPENKDFSGRWHNLTHGEICEPFKTRDDSGTGSNRFAVPLDLQQRHARRGERHDASIVVKAAFTAFLDLTCRKMLLICSRPTMK